MRVILNADDLGISDRVNDAIFDVLDRGRITSATLMANGPAFMQAASQVPRFKNCSFGVHLNLTSFESLTKDPGFGEYLDDDGCFSGNVRQYRMNAAFRNAVLREWRTQVQRVLNHGVPVSHFDSHHHVHTIPRLFGALKQLQREFGIRRVRATRNLYASNNVKLKARLCAKAAWNWALRTFWTTRTTEGFTDLTDFVILLDRKPPQCRTVELMLHPGHSNCTNETALLDQPWRDHAPYPIELISYHDL